MRHTVRHANVFKETFKENKIYPYTKDYELVGTIKDATLSTIREIQQVDVFGNVDFRTASGCHRTIFGTITFSSLDIDKLIKIKDFHVENTITNLFINLITKHNVLSNAICYSKTNDIVYEPILLDVEQEDGKMWCIEGVFLINQLYGDIEFPCTMRYVAERIEFDV